MPILALTRGNVFSKVQQILKSPVTDESKSVKSRNENVRDQRHEITNRKLALSTNV